MKYYAVISTTNDGPAFGVGTTEQDAVNDAHEWGIDPQNRNGTKVVEITEASYNAILGGNPDAVETAP